jgi:hypothetical protein
MEEGRGEGRGEKGKRGRGDEGRGKRGRGKKGKKGKKGKRGRGEEGKRGRGRERGKGKREEGLEKNEEYRLTSFLGLYGPWLAHNLGLSTTYLRELLMGCSHTTSMTFTQLLGAQKLWKANILESQFLREKCILGTFFFKTCGIFSPIISPLARHKKLNRVYL